MEMLHVATYFLSKADEEQGVLITHLKLQKLAYYAQAWHLAIHGTRLFHGHFEARARGPVSPVLFQTYQNCGYSPIPFPEHFREDVYSEEDKAFLEDVWNAYGKFDAKYLEQLTHQEQPWLEARGTLPEGVCSDQVISDEAMKQYYGGLLEDE